MMGRPASRPPFGSRIIAAKRCGAPTRTVSRGGSRPSGARWPTPGMGTSRAALTSLGRPGGPGMGSCRAGRGQGAGAADRDHASRSRQACRQSPTAAANRGWRMAASTSSRQSPGGSMSAIAKSGPRDRRTTRSKVQHLRRRRRNRGPRSARFRSELAPGVGLEPTTQRLTAACSTN